jgi:hypothetical protein
MLNRLVPADGHPCGLYFGIDAARFCSALGWGNTALTAGLILYWAAAVGWRPSWTWLALVHERPVEDGHLPVGLARHE